jgi:uncharacterized integral membrane protein (TIGR00698 family)
VTGTLQRYLPGLALSAALGVAGLAVSAAESRLFGQAVVEGLVAAILLGALVRSVWTPPLPFQPGIRLASRTVLEVAVFLLGASVNLPLLLRAGPSLAAGIALVVFVSLASSLAIAAGLGLPARLGVLVACGNAICGNSAIAAVAPVIGAEREHVASAITFTAILGIGVVLVLPALAGPLHLSHYQYGVVAGLTVYAVPQVLAAAFPVSALSGEVGTLVKLVRVLLLGPVVLFFAVRHGRRTGVGTLRWSEYLPWFIVGFIALAVLRALDVLPAAVVGPSRLLSGWLTILAMAALGLGVDLREVARVGRPLVLAVSASLVVLLGLSVALVHALGIR